ncbi:histidine kinase [Hephaestia caeni]|uniref:histidine kinase n=1 Tax=Hephaestia caeni TaxID=645617 RepID=A0A397PHF5_9SPHN|nr:HAMP domain-containing sensor histidine kinase [Hephaestia caeni]RIA46597.1 histidine kinase [Hephaestia caeni]
MNAIDRDLPPVRGRVDRAGRLIEADRRLDDLNEAAGGAIGAPLAIPALAELARLVRRLGVLVSRRVVVADGRSDLETWVRAEPDGGDIRLTLTGWRQRPAATPRAASAGLPAPVTNGGWRWETDAALRLIALSPEAGPRDGFHPAAVLGQPLTSLFGLVEEADGALPLLAALAASQRFDGQRATVRPSGRPVVLAGAPRRDRLGAFGGFAGTATDAVNEAMWQPTGMDVFTTRLGAALRAPLGRIIANADSISAAPDGPVNETYAGYAADIATAGRHLLGLVDDLVDIEAVERVDFAVACEPIDLADLARRAAGLLSVRASAAEVTIERPAASARLAATGEFRRVLQILVNLIGNAVRYAPPGSMVTVRAERRDAVAEVTVIDRGKGLAPEDQARVFEKFERVDPLEPGGNGLGLYIARRLARAMGGDVTLASAPGEGARFTLSLPARD